MQPLLNLNILQKPLLYTFDAVSMLALLTSSPAGPAGPFRTAITTSWTPGVGAVRPAAYPGGFPGRRSVGRRDHLVRLRGLVQHFRGPLDRTPMPGSFPPSQPSGWRWRICGAHGGGVKSLLLPPR